MTDASAISGRLKHYILSEFLPGEVPENLTETTPLRTSGVLDSIATVKLVSFVEDEFNIALAAHETGIQNFDTIADLTALIVRKQDGA